MHGAIDNAFAMAEDAKADIAVVCGGDNSWNQLIVQPDIGSVADLRGKTVIVDAPNTAYALQLYDMLRAAGLKKGDYEVKVVGATFRRARGDPQGQDLAATMLNPPFSIRAEKAGLKNIGSAVKTIGPYQATGGFVMRAWAKANEDTLVKYLQAYVEGVRWSLDPTNKAEAVGLLVERLKLPRMWRRSPMRSRRCAEGLRQGCADRPRRLPQRAQAAGDASRHVGRQPARSCEVHRSELLPEGAGGDVAPLP